MILSPQLVLVEGNCYWVHEDGNIESKHRRLKPQDSGKGYKYVCLGKGPSKRFYRNYYIHRLVASCFIPNLLNLPEVNHKDGDKSNNHKDNLEWCTRLYNITDYRLKGRARYPEGRKVTQITILGEKLRTWKNCAEAARSLGCTGELIAMAAKGRVPKAKGFIWKYETEDE